MKTYLTASNEKLWRLRNIYVLYPIQEAEKALVGVFFERKKTRPHRMNVLLLIINKKYYVANMTVALLAAFSLSHNPMYNLVHILYTGNLSETMRFKYEKM